MLVVKPDPVTFANIVPACSIMGALEEGMNIHQKVVKNGFELKFMGISSLLDVYAKYERI